MRVPLKVFTIGLHSFNHQRFLRSDENLGKEERREERKDGKEKKDRIRRRRKGRKKRRRREREIPDHHLVPSTRCTQSGQ